MMQKIAIVTGAASGIGEAVSEKLLERGTIVYGIDIKEPVRKKGINYIQCDVSSELEIINAISIIKQKTPHIHFLVNAAGILCSESRFTIDQLPLKEWEMVMQTNLTGVFLMMKYAIALMNDTSMQSAIVNISSEQTRNPVLKGVPYAVSKAGVEMLSKIAAKELSDKNIRVNTVAAASVRTGFIRPLISSNEEYEMVMQKADDMMPLGIIEPHHIADMVMFLLSDQACKITGQTFFVDSGTLL